MKEFEGKKLLVLGGSNAEVDVVKIAQSLGCYVIVTDHYTDKSVIPAKLIADEAWNISWTDYDSLETKCREAGVNGVIAGFSEFRVESMIEMCERLGLPCYINREQLEVTRDKNKFKQMCKRYGVPIVNEYAPDSSDIRFPVIIKPTDRGGSIGINVAYNEEEYKKHLAYAYEMSPSKSVVVEDFIGDGVKFDVSYYISGRDVTLIESCDTVMLSKEKGYETMQKAWTFPSKREPEYIEQVDAQVKAMLADLGMLCGVANISFFYRNGQFYVFETGFRLGGGHSFDYQRNSGGIDYLTAMIKYALGIPFKVETALPSRRGYAVTYNVYFKPQVDSKVCCVNGEDIVRNLPETVTYIPYLYSGLPVDSVRPRKIAMCTLYSHNLDTILKDISLINSSLTVKTDNELCLVFSELTHEDVLSSLFIRLIGIIKETKTPVDNRVALSPKQVAELNQKYPRQQIIVQSSDIRAFSDEEYSAEGVPVVQNVENCDVLFGIKEAKIDSLIPNRQYFFFGHIAKMQEYNRPLLQAFIQKRITFCDYEYLVDDNNQRVCAFGWWAGVVGVYYTLRGYGLKHKLFDLPKPDIHFTLEKLIASLKSIDLPKVKLLVTGAGRVSQGAQYALDKIGAQRMSEEVFLSGGTVDKLSYCVADVDRLVKRKDGGVFSWDDFTHNVEAYESNFMRWAVQTDVLICAHFWGPDAPVYLSEDDLRRKDMRIRMIGDVTCDIKGSIKSTVRPATHDDPYYDYNPVTEQDEPAFSSPDNITEMAVDTCPNALALDTSEYFGKMLTQHVFEPLLKGDFSAVIERSMILKDGQLTSRFDYLKAFARDA